MCLTASVMLPPRNHVRAEPRQVHLQGRSILPGAAALAQGRGYATEGDSEAEASALSPAL